MTLLWLQKCFSCDFLPETCVIMVIYHIYVIQYQILAEDLCTERGRRHCHHIKSTCFMHVCATTNVLSLEHITVSSGSNMKVMLCIDVLSYAKMLFEFVDLGNKLEFETNLSLSFIK
jgi:hypothetical protein